MGLFTSKKKAWRQSIEAHNDSQGQFQRLAQTIGREKARKFVELIYDWAKDSNMQINTLAPDIVSDFIKRERKNVVQKRGYVNQLAAQSKSNALGTALNNNLRSVNDYYNNPTANLAGRELAIDKAANWVCGNYVAGIGNTRSLLREYIPTQAGHHGKAGLALGNSPQHVRRIHKKAVPNAPAYRFNYLGGDVKYPSTVGASVLLDELFRLTAGTNAWPPFGNAAWESLAMFYLASLVTIQAFSDGNKRVGHIAYAIVLIKGTHDFKAPSTAKENELFAMNG